MTIGYTPNTDSKWSWRFFFNPMYFWFLGAPLCNGSLHLGCFGIQRFSAGCKRKKSSNYNRCFQSEQERKGQWLTSSRFARISHIWIRKTSHDIEVIQWSVGGAWLSGLFLGIRHQLQVPITDFCPGFKVMILSASNFWTKNKVQYQLYQLIVHKTCHFLCIKIQLWWFKVIQVHTKFQGVWSQLDDP